MFVHNTTKYLTLALVPFLAACDLSLAEDVEAALNQVQETYKTVKEEAEKAGGVATLVEDLTKAAVIEVADAASPINGAKVELEADSFDTDVKSVVVSIKKDEDVVSPDPTLLQFAGPTVKYEFVDAKSNKPITLAKPAKFVLPVTATAIPEGFELLPTLISNDAFEIAIDENTGTDVATLAHSVFPSFLPLATVSVASCVAIGTWQEMQMGCGYWRKSRPSSTVSRTDDVTNDGDGSNTNGNDGSGGSANVGQTADAQDIGSSWAFQGEQCNQSCVGQTGATLQCTETCEPFDYYIYVQEDGSYLMYAYDGDQSCWGSIPLEYMGAEVVSYTISGNDITVVTRNEVSYQSSDGTSGTSYEEETITGTRETVNTWSDIEVNETVCADAIQ